jgi:hypothetical protein
MDAGYSGRWISSRAVWLALRTRDQRRAPLCMSLLLREVQYDQRSFEQDALQCPACGGRRSIIAFLDDPIIVQKILKHLGIEGRPRPPPIEGQQELF